MQRFSRLLIAAILVAIAGVGIYGQGLSQTPRPVGSKSDETLRMWNSIGDRVVAMAADFPEDKYDFKVQKDQRTFAENLLHIAGVDYILMRAISGKNMGPDLGKDPENPPREMFKTKADVVRFVKQAVADGAALIKEQGDAGLDKASKFPFGNMMVHNSYNWTVAIEHSGEHYGQLVVYYRANNMVPPASRQQ
ncbi:MAG: DinB family protein [Candidatus Acidiferrales bacterium]